jgi:lipoprotein-anchoring transpeptidase ErfK/SrfK
MVRPGTLVPLLAALLLAVLGLAAATASRARNGPANPAPAPATAPAAPAPGAQAAAPAPRLRSLETVGGARTRPAARAADRAPSFETLRIRSGHSVNLRSGPHGRVVATVAARTDFGSPAALSVAARRGHWVGVPSSQLPNGKLGWIDERTHSAARLHGRMQIVVRLSERRLELRVGGRVKRRVRVAIGRPGSTTPTGHFSVTDKLAGGRYGPYYGCCILALSGHQPHPPPGWQGGSRLAIHGTNAPGSIGVPSSAGCMHASERDLRVLMRRVPLGTPVLIRK